MLVYMDHSLPVMVFWEDVIHAKNVSYLRCSNLFIRQACRKRMQCVQSWFSYKEKFRDSHGQNS